MRACRGAPHFLPIFYGPIVVFPRWAAKDIRAVEINLKLFNPKNQVVNIKLPVLFNPLLY
ncbi:hypothetical protein EAM_0924 [Erwinia amylovora ATCC 49946]|nr:hypothetical protein EAM_0924 [Erwinia amylovora ATCC 49946]